MFKLILDWPQGRKAPDFDIRIFRNPNSIYRSLQMPSRPGQIVGAQPNRWGNAALQQGPRKIALVNLPGMITG